MTETSKPQSENPPSKIDVQGLIAYLENGATVFGCSQENGVLWTFNKDGIVTPLKLSHQAMEAMVGIWQNLRDGAA